MLGKFSEHRNLSPQRGLVIAFETMSEM